MVCAEDVAAARLLAEQLDPVLVCKCRTELSNCPHVRRQKDHDLLEGDWLDLLMLAYPGEYEEPPPPGEPARIRDQADAVEVYRRRLGRGCHLYHPDDVWRSAEAQAHRRGLRILKPAGQDTPVPFDPELHALILAVLARGRAGGADDD
jgi:hypothetical protein